VLALLGYLKIIYFMKANICFSVLGTHGRFLLVVFFLLITIKIVISDVAALEALEFFEDLEYYWNDGYGYELTHRIACPAIADMFAAIR